MSLFAKQPIYCPACGVLHTEHVARTPLASSPGIELCCSADCREAIGIAHARYVMGESAPNGKGPLAELLLSRLKTYAGKKIVES